MIVVRAWECLCGRREPAPIEGTCKGCGERGNRRPLHRGHEDGARSLPNKRLKTIHNVRKFTEEKGGAVGAFAGP